MSPSNRAPRGRRKPRPSSRASARQSARAGGSNRTWIVVGVLAVVVLVAVVIAVAAGGSDSSSKASKDAVEVAPVQVSGDVLASFPSGGSDPAVGSTVPTLTGTSLFDGSKITIAPTGKPMAIVYLAHWCPHCQAEVPRIVALANAGKLDGLDVRTVAAAGHPELPNYPPSTWLQSEDWPYPTMVDSKQSTAANAYGLTGYPFFMLVDAQGKVVARSEGEISENDLLAAIDAFLAGKPVDLGSGASSSSK